MLNEDLDVTNLASQLTFMQSKVSIGKCVKSLISSPLYLKIRRTAAYWAEVGWAIIWITRIG